MPVANHGDPWQKPSQLCNYLPIKILKCKFKIRSMYFYSFFLIKVIFLIPSDLEGFPQGIAE